MTVTELKKKCEGMIADGYGDSEIIIAKGEEYPTFFPLERGFSSVVYNRESIQETIKEMGLEEDDCVVLN